MNPHSPAPKLTTQQQTQRAAAAVLYTALVLLALWMVREFIPAVAWAGVIAIALWPAFRGIESRRWFKGRTTLIAALLTLAVGLLVLLPVALGIAQAAGEAHSLIGWVRSVQETGVPVPDFVTHLPFGGRQLTDWWQANLAQPLGASPAMKDLHGNAVVAFGQRFGLRAAHALLHFVFTLLTVFVIFQAGPRLSGTLLRGAERAFGQRGVELAQRMGAAVRGTVSGLVVVGLGEGVLLGAGYAMAGVPHAALLGAVTAVAAMLPFCAPIVFCGVALWLALVPGATVAAFALAAAGFVITFVADHFVRPVLIGNSSRLPFLLVLFGILGGAGTFGLLGIFIGPALMTILMVLWDEWLQPGSGETAARR
ncbi:MULTISPECIES: AI-2E family transporter [Paraburkholderia]|uniref:AI-2E family transporter n=1 Tax=Paraburkholderia TaxID=1822464 RepID=UPI000F88502C|nr:MULTISPECIES: AI-2E family transporter [Paraburkholderia]WEY42943.1 AI-2E family transporter [Paraburkholderia sp. SUR17]